MKLKVLWAAMLTDGCNVSVPVVHDYNIVFITVAVQTITPCVCTETFAYVYYAHTLMTQFYIMEFNYCNKHS